MREVKKKADKYSSLLRNNRMLNLYILLKDYAITRMKGREKKREVECTGRIPIAIKLCQKK